MFEKFEKAIRLKLRFETTKGSLNIEDLYDMSLVSLDNIAKAINRKLKAEGEESFIGRKSSSTNLLQLSLDILKYVIDTKMEEEKVSKLRVERIGELSMLKDLLVNKKVEELKGLSVDEIQKRIGELEA